jgi:hypothetical protein
MEANEITFGIEIECHVPASTMIIPGGYHQGTQVAGFPVGWNAQRDGSIRSGRNRIPVEIVSPVLKGADGVRQILEVVRKLNQMGAKVNPSCGFHVHVGFPDNPAQIDRITHLAANFEKAIFASTGTKNRERGTYCRSIKNTHRHDAGRRSRYHLLNLTNILSGTKPTVEFRAFSGTLNISKILGYVRMCVGLVERALEMKKLPKWDAEAPQRKRARVGGKGGVTRMCYYLGWTKGRTEKVYGNLFAEGAPALEASKYELLRLAEKYDLEA